MNRFAVLLSTSLLCAAFGCEDRSTTQGPSTGPTPNKGWTEEGNAGGGDVHEGEEHDLGTQKAGAYEVKATQIGEVKAGSEMVFELTVTGGTAKPSAVRGWVGTENGQGSSKAKAEAEEKGYHFHIDVPSPMPAGSKFWVELETAGGSQRASFNLEEHDHDHEKKDEAAKKQGA
ncbi:MAG TPA: hypothetical protein VFB66_04465 [Tepidisphaeraceae bacterium]|nr:hypothetical protein [Tepidisphaeraceae bacterium]